MVFRGRFSVGCGLKPSFRSFVAKASFALPWLCRTHTPPFPETPPHRKHSPESLPDNDNCD